MLLVVYAALAHVGAVSGGAFPGATNGAGVLTNLVSWLYGPVGSVLLGLVFVIACLNTCIGLFSCCSEYFCQMVPKISYRVWVAIFAAISFLIAIAGLDTILAVSTPVLNAIYPVAIVLIILGLAHRLTGKVPGCYLGAVAFTGIVSVLYALDTAKLPVPFVTELVRMLPLYTEGLCWLLPALVGGILGALLSRTKRK